MPDIEWEVKDPKTGQVVGTIKGPADATQEQLAAHMATVELPKPAGPMIDYDRVITSGLKRGLFGIPELIADAPYVAGKFLDENLPPIAHTGIRIPFDRPSEVMEKFVRTDAPTGAGEKIASEAIGGAVSGGMTGPMSATQKIAASLAAKYGAAAGAGAGAGGEIAGQVAGDNPVSRLAGSLLGSFVGGAGPGAANWVRTARRGDSIMTPGRVEGLIGDQPDIAFDAAKKAMVRSPGTLPAQAMNNTPLLSLQERLSQIPQIGTKIVDALGEQAENLKGKLSGLIGLTSGPKDPQVAANNLRNAATERVKQVDQSITNEARPFYEIPTATRPYSVTKQAPSSVLGPNGQPVMVPQTTTQNVEIATKSGTPFLPDLTDRLAQRVEAQAQRLGIPPNTEASRTVAAFAKSLRESTSFKQLNEAYETFHAKLDTADVKTSMDTHSIGQVRDAMRPVDNFLGTVQNDRAAGKAVYTARTPELDEISRSSVGQAAAKTSDESVPANVQKLQNLLVGENVKAQSILRLAAETKKVDPAAFGQMVRTTLEKQFEKAYGTQATGQAPTNAPGAIVQKLLSTPAQKENFRAMIAGATNDPTAVRGAERVMEALELASRGRGGLGSTIEPPTISAGDVGRLAMVPIYPTTGAAAVGRTVSKLGYGKSDIQLAKLLSDGSPESIEILRQMARRSPSDIAKAIFGGAAPIISLQGVKSEKD